MSIEADLIAYFYFGADAFQGDEPDRWGGGFGQLRLAFFTDVRAAGKLDLFGSQLHRKGKAGWKSAFLAIGLGE